MGIFESIFIFLTIALWVGASALCLKLIRPPLSFGLLAFLLGWLFLLGTLSLRGFFRDFSTVPPHLLFVVAPPFIVIALLIYTPGLGERLAGLKPSILVGYQAFRILMEFLLYELVAAKRLPEILTFTGSNDDVLVGLTAPLAILLFLRCGKENYGALQIWNVCGFLILMNTLIHGIGSVPTTLQIFHTTPPNTLIAEFPWIFLPGFVAPAALAGHVLSFRQLSALRRRKLVSSSG